MASSISEEEIEREVRTLKNLRRRSASAPGPGDLALDPDLPPPDAFSTGPSYSSNDDVTLATPDGLDGDAGLFWVPAHLHPELAPGEFRAFLKQHTQVDPGAVETGESGEAALARSPSWLARNNSLSGGLGRKKSMLSRQYTPRAGDKVEDEAPPVPVRRPSMYAGRNADKGLTLHDLQKLEELVEDADLSDDPEKMRKMLRRSLSMNVAPGFLEETPQGERSEADTPIVVPRPGSIIRRTARTKIRKGGPGEGGSRRFSSTRRGRLTSPSSGAVDQVEEGDSLRSEDRRSDETESEEHSSESPHASLTSSDSVVVDSARPPVPALAPTKLPVPHPQVVQQPPSPDLSRASEDEALIYDAYAGDRTSTSTSSSLSIDNPSRSPSPDSRGTATSSERVHHPPNLPPIVTPKAGEGAWFEDDQLTPTQESSMSAALHAMSLLPSSGPSEDIFQQQHQQQPHHLPTAPARHAEPEPKTPTAARPYSDLPPGMAPPSQRVAPPPSIVVPQRNGQLQVPTLERPSLSRTDSAASSSSNASSAASSGKEKIKEKEKKGGLFSKKSHSHDKDKDKDKGEKKKKEKDRFLGSLFGNKKKHEEASSVSNFATAGPAAAAALLGTSKSAKSLHAAGSGTSSPTSPGFSNFARYPIHVERAVYRLSHIKLANARRPLIEQVLISNLMFWYLGVIGRTAGPAEDKKPGSVNGIDRERDEQLRTPPLKGTPSKPADSGSAGVKQPDQPLQPSPVSPVSPRKAGLTKPERSRGNNSEAAYRAPQYGMQTVQMDKDMRGQPHSKQPSQHSQQQHSPIHHNQQPSQQYQPQSAAPPPRTASMPASPNRVRSPPPNGQPQQYPPGVAPPARPAMPQPSGGGAYGIQGGGGGGGGGHQRPVAVPEGRDPRRPQPPPGGQHGPHPAQAGVRPGQQYPPNGADPRRSGEGHRPYPQQHSSSGSGGGSAGSPQPGQIFQYPGGGGNQYGRPGGPAPGQHYSAQPGQIFHHPQFQQRPAGSGMPQNWEPPQRLPPGQQQQRAPGPALAQGPPRRTSSNTQDPYGRPGGPAYGGGGGGGGGGSRDGQTSPTNQGFYSQRNPGQPAYPYPPSGGGQARPQPVPSGQYPHHR